MSSRATVRRSKRWDFPFAGAPLRAEMASALLMLPIFKGIDAADFPSDLAPVDIIANDGRILEFARGEPLFRKGEYGSSVFIVLIGGVSCALPAPEKRPAAKPGVLDRIDLRGSLKHLAGLKNTLTRKPKNEPEPDPAAELEQAEELFAAGPNDIVGLVSALSRTERQHSAYASEHHTRVLELRWPGLRELRYWSDEFSSTITKIYRSRAIDRALRMSRLFAGLEPSVQTAIAGQATFEVHGDNLWSHRFQRQRSGGISVKNALENEPVIVGQGHYLDELIIVHAGFARQTRTVDQGERNERLLSSGDAFGFDLIADSIANDRPCKLPVSLQAVGYAEIIKIPTPVVEATLLQMPSAASRMTYANGHDSEVLDFTLETRLMNGMQALVIDLDRCVNCDDCVRACAATHGSVPRFKRQGHAIQNVLVAQACMHCADPVCLIDCPTEAISRERETGTVKIDEASCIGCAACASACPYDNIQMMPVLDHYGQPLSDEDGSTIQRATKCDLCFGSSTGPVCVQICPHDALSRKAPIEADDYLVRVLP